MRPVPESIVGSLAGTSPATLGLRVDPRETGTGLRRIPRAVLQASRSDQRFADPTERVAGAAGEQDHAYHPSLTVIPLQLRHWDRSGRDRSDTAEYLPLRAVSEKGRR
jgi:hypothetical protein